MYIVNAPFIFTAIWAIVKGFIDEKTRKKISIMGGKYKKTLLAAVPAANLPIWLGGDCTCEEYGGCLIKEVGPWMDDLRPRIGESGELSVSTHQPMLIPRYVGEPAPTITAESGSATTVGKGTEEAKKIEDDDAAVVKSATEATGLAMKEAEAMGASDSLKAALKDNEGGA